MPLHSYLMKMQLVDQPKVNPLVLELHVKHNIFSQADQYMNKFLLCP